MSVIVSRRVHTEVLLWSHSATVQNQINSINNVKCQCTEARKLQDGADYFQVYDEFEAEKEALYKNRD